MARILDAASHSRSLSDIRRRSNLRRRASRGAGARHQRLARDGRWPADRASQPDKHGCTPRSDQRPRRSWSRLRNNPRVWRRARPGRMEYNRSRYEPRRPVWEGLRGIAWGRRETARGGTMHREQTTRGRTRAGDREPDIVGISFAPPGLRRIVVQAAVDPSGNSAWFSPGRHEQLDPSVDQFGLVGDTCQVVQRRCRCLDRCHRRTSSLSVRVEGRDTPSILIVSVRMSRRGELISDRQSSECPR